MNTGGLAGIAQNLQFHPGKCWIAGWRRSQKNAAVTFGSGAILQPQNEIVISIVGCEPASTLHPSENPFAGAPGSGVGRLLDGVPMGKRFAVEEQRKSLLALLMGQPVRAQGHGDTAKENSKMTEHKERSAISFQLTAKPASPALKADR
jgi:hypothetical protein